MATVLITGGAGFIGSFLCDTFIAQGYDVVCVDNFLSGSRDNIKHVLDNPHFELIEHDVTQPLVINRQLDGILHFASPASPNPNSQVSYMAHPIETLMVNSLGTKNVLDLATEQNCQIILASTSEVYGDPAIHPQTEDYNGNVSPNGPRSCYDEGKRFLEAIAFAYYRKHQTKIKVIRIFNTYGPRMMLDEGRFIPSVVDSIINGTPFHRFGDGQVTRSFCYVDDLVHGIERVYRTEKMIGEVVNLGNPQEYTLNEAIDLAQEITGKKIKIMGGDSLKDDPQRRCPDITKAQTILEWEPHVDLRDGLTQMIKSYAE